MVNQINVIVSLSDKYSYLSSIVSAHSALRLFLSIMLIGNSERVWSVWTDGQRRAAVGAFYLRCFIVEVLLFEMFICDSMIDLVLRLCYMDADGGSALIPKYFASNVKSEEAVVYIGEFFPVCLFILNMFSCLVLILMIHYLPIHIASRDSSFSSFCCLSVPDAVLPVASSPSGIFDLNLINPVN